MFAYRITLAYVLAAYNLDRYQNTWQRIFLTDSGVATVLKKYLPTAVFLPKQHNYHEH